MVSKNPSWFEAVMIGMISSGINKPTRVVLNLVFALLVLSLIPLVFIAREYGGWLYLNVVLLLVFVVIHIGLMNWVLSQLGTVEIKDQVEELFGKPASEDVKDDNAVSKKED